MKVGPRLALAICIIASPILSVRAEDPLPGAGKAPPRKVDAVIEKRVNKSIDCGVEWLSRRETGGRFAERPGNPRADPKFPPEDLPVRPGRPGDVVVRFQDSARVNWLGEDALALYTLRSCGVPAGDRHVVSGFRWLREEYVALRDSKRLANYTVSLLLLALEAHRNPPVDPGPDDSRYGRSARRSAPVPPEDLEWMKELTAWIVQAQNKYGGFSYMSPGYQGIYDHSNSQFSLLALKAARRCGIPVPQELWTRALELFLRNQEETGPEVVRREPVDPGGSEYGRRTAAGPRDHARGWGYATVPNRNPATGSMTAAGVSSVVICRSELLGTPGYDSALDARAERSIRDGLAWLGLHFSVEENPGPADAPMMAKTWQYYYLYGLERAGVLASVEWMADHAWYPEGAVYLVQNQDPAGWWEQKGRFRMAGLPPADQRRIDGLDSHRNGDLLDTCWALLFLKRATVPVTRGSVATPAGGDALDLSFAESLGDRPFRDVFDAVFGRYLASDAASRSARTTDFLRLGKRALPLLILRLEDPDEGSRAAAMEVLHRTTGVSQGYDPKGPEEARSAAIRAWEEWWMAKGKILVADVDAGRFRE